ncbi:MAG: iron complex outerrane recepter protein [Gammaproteobacteria bacterium]|nr:iron complex outerrane recepter protein [Gammaproteobacteria bacterium]
MVLRDMLVSAVTTALMLAAVAAAETPTPGAESENVPSESVAPGATDSEQSAEVVITAQKRASTVQETPISIAAVSGEDLRARGVPSLAALAQGTPGVSLKSEGPSQTEIEMRGMTSSGGNSATVGFYLDDIPLAGPASAQNGHVVIDPDLYDLNRIEILRGPQGTLFGSGSMGGTVRLITNQPNLSQFQSSAQSVLSGTDGGGFNHKDSLMINLPLLDDTLALRVVGTENHTSGWIDRIVVNPFPLAGGNPVGTVRGDVQNAPVENRYPGSNAYQTYAARVTLLWKPTDDLSIAPSYFHVSSTQNGISAYDSTPGSLAHYQPFDIAEPLTDSLAAYSLNVNYKFPLFDLTSSTARWSRNSTQVEEAGEAFNNPLEGITYNSNNGLPNPGFYGPTGSGPEHGIENDPSHQFSEELRLTSTGNGRLRWVTGLYYSDFYSLWDFNGTTPNYAAFMDLGTLAPATTPNWFDSYSPTTLKQYAGFGDATYALTDELDVDVGARVNHYDYRFSSCISGWGSGNGAATPSCSGRIALSSTSFNPKFNLSYKLSPDLMMYATVASGFRPGGGNAVYPTTGAAWGGAFKQQGYTGGKWPTSYEPDRVLSYEVGEKARMLDRRLTVNASVYYEDWRHVQLESFPNDWALNINGNYAHIYGADIDMRADLGSGLQLEVAAGYLYEYLDGGPHWVIAPIHKLPDVAPVSGNAALSYTRALGSAYTLTARLEATYTGPRYSISFPDPYEFTGTYIQLPSYTLANIRIGVEFRDKWSATAFVNNVTNKQAQLESMFTENEPQPSFTRIETNQPLTAGIDLSYRF